MTTIYVKDGMVHGYTVELTQTFEVDKALRLAVCLLRIASWMQNPITRIKMKLGLIKF